MPFVRVSYLDNQYTEAELPIISQCILETLMTHFHVPADDYFQIFHGHSKHEFYYDPQYLGVARSDRLLYIHISLASGRSTEQKRQFYRALASLISTKCQICDNDIFVVLHETEREDWSFGKGLAQMI
ncbi:tautomerase [Paenibacillus pectinilyticus]|uniref:Tautomerase n=1 Tax=Paenibacillus pectinilyticus TaxID=512399 RepID=A0A1C1A5V8_9BACL|nr:tautomerase family protein [Paenibacillus pectinilyticus]OCT15944.1 tautomerase [Paenibacillus pectinilyticus]